MEDLATDLFVGVESVIEVLKVFCGRGPDRVVDLAREVVR